MLLTLVSLSVSAWRINVNAAATSIVINHQEFHWEDERIDMLLSRSRKVEAGLLKTTVYVELTAVTIKRSTGLENSSETRFVYNRDINS